MKMIITIIALFVSLVIQAQPNGQFNPRKDSLIIKEITILNAIRQNPQAELQKRVQYMFDTRVIWDTVKTKQKYGLTKFINVFDYDSLKATTPVVLDDIMCISARALTRKMLESNRSGHATSAEIATVISSSKTPISKGGFSENLTGGGSIDVFLVEGNDVLTGRPHRDDILKPEYKRAGICVVVSYKDLNTKEKSYWGLSISELKSKVEKDGFKFNPKYVKHSVRLYLK